MGIFSPLLNSGRRTSLGLALAGASLLGACTSNVSGDLNTAALGQSGDAVITMAAVIDRNREMSCMSLKLETVDGQVPRTSSGQRIFSLKLGSGTILDPNSEM